MKILEFTRTIPEDIRLNHLGICRPIPELVLDPRVWEAIGKAKEWGEGEIAVWRSERAKMTVPEFYMHNLVEALFEGETIESFIKTL